MWARVAEFLLAIWLVSCTPFFPCPVEMSPLWLSNWICASLIAFFALMSFVKSFQKIHLCSIAVAFWLIGVGFRATEVPSPFIFQNQLITGTILLMLVLVPSHALKPPHEWVGFYQNAYHHRISAWPSRWSQRVALSCVSAGAVIMALYMGFYQWGIVPGVWDPVFGQQTEMVLESNISLLFIKWLRMPDAIFGAIAYLGDCILAFAGSSRRWHDRPWVVLLFGLYVIPPAIVSIILVFIQGSILANWCFLCLVTAAISILLIFLSYTEVWITLQYLHRIWKEKKDKRLLWETLWGKPSAAAYEIACKMPVRHI